MNKNELPPATSEIGEKMSKIIKIEKAGEIFMKEVMTPANISAEELEKILNIKPAGQIKKFIEGKGYLPKKSMQEISKYFGLSENFLWNLHQDYKKISKERYGLGKELTEILGFKNKFQTAKELNISNMLLTKCDTGEAGNTAIKLIILLIEILKETSSSKKKKFVENYKKRILLHEGKDA